MNLARLSPMLILAIATISMLFQQAFSYVCQIVMPILADRLAEDFAISRAWLGLYLFIQNVAAIIAAAGCGSFILRYGPLRISQVTLFMMGASLVVVALGQLWLYPVAAIMLGAAAVSTPASSHILAQVCPPRLVSVVFSIKQTGVPVGSLIGGFMVPFLLGLVFYSATVGTTIRLGPYGAAFVTALVVFSVGFMLQPIRDYFDRDRNPDQKIGFGDIRTTLSTVVGNPALRDLSFAAFAFGGLQAIFAGFFILFLIDGLGYSEIEAGGAFALSSFTAILARVLWGVVGDTLLTPRWMLGLIGLFGAVAAQLMTDFDITWSLNQIIAVAILYNITALSWHGVLLAETARLAPEGQVGGVTGGVLAFTSIAMMIYPALYGILLAVTDSYGIGFGLAAVPSLIAFLIFAAPAYPGSWARASLSSARHLTSPRGLARTATVLATGIGLGLLLHALGLGG